LKPLRTLESLETLERLEHRFQGTDQDYELLDRILNHTHPAEVLEVETWLGPVFVDSHAIERLRERHKLYAQGTRDEYLSKDLELFFSTGHIYAGESCHGKTFWQIEHWLPIWDRMLLVCEVHENTAKITTVKESRYGKSGNESLMNGTGGRLVNSVLAIGNLFSTSLAKVLEKFSMIESSGGVLWGEIRQLQDKILVCGLTAHEILDLLVSIRIPGRGDVLLSHLTRLKRRFCLEEYAPIVKDNVQELAQLRGVRVSDPNSKLLGTLILRSLNQRLQEAHDESDPR
jgi:hypothetical protein